MFVATHPREVFNYTDETVIANSYPPYAVKLKVPFSRPFTDEDFISKLPIPKYWFDPKHIPEKMTLIDYLIHPIKKDYNADVGYCSEGNYRQGTNLGTDIVRVPMKDLVWKNKYEFWWSCIDIINNENSADLVHPRFTKWLEERDLILLGWDIFITPPNMWLLYHKDTYNECCKLNFVYHFNMDGYSCQSYFDDNAKGDGIVSGDPDVKYRIPPEVKPKMIHEHNLSNDLTMPSLTNIGKWHCVYNSTSGPRVCLSYMIGRKNGKDVTWDKVYPQVEKDVIW